MCSRLNFLCSSRTAEIAAPEPMALAIAEELDDPDDRRRSSKESVRSGRRWDREDDEDDLPAPRPLLPTRAVSLPVRPCLVRRRSQEGPAMYSPITPELIDTAAFHSAYESASSACSSHSGEPSRSSSFTSPAISRRSSSSSSCNKSVRWASLVMSVSLTHGSSSYDRAPCASRARTVLTHAGSSSECDSLAIPACKGSDDADRWLRVEVDPHRDSSPIRGRQMTESPARIMPVPSRSLSMPERMLDDDEDDVFAYDSPLEARWHGQSRTASASFFDSDVLNGF